MKQPCVFWRENRPSSTGKGGKKQLHSNKWDSSGLVGALSSSSGIAGALAAASNMSGQW